MRRLTRAPFLWIVAALATAGAILAISSATDDGTPSTTSTRVGSQSPPPPESKPTTRHHARRPGGGTRKQVHEAVTESPAPRLDPAQGRIARVVRAYVAALNAHDGARTCALFVPGGLSSVHFPRDRGACAPSVSASVGYRDPRGFPVYERSRVARIPKVTVNASGARVTATVVTRFAEGREPSIEDDVVYLTKRGGRWLIAKPSATFYRAIGTGNIPPSVLAPP